MPGEPAALLGEIGVKVLRQTTRWCSQFFTFITDRAVPPTNNPSEQAQCPSVIFRKVTKGFRSLWGADVHVPIGSVIGTGRPCRPSHAPSPDSRSSPDQPPEQLLWRD